MKVGDVIKLDLSTRKNGRYAGKLALIVDLDAWENPTVNVEGEIRSFHYTQIAEVVSENR
jgi:hypothetical protein